MLDERMPRKVRRPKLCMMTMMVDLPVPPHPMMMSVIWYVSNSCEPRSVRPLNAAEMMNRSCVVNPCEL